MCVFDALLFRCVMTAHCEWPSDRGPPSGHEIAVTKSMSVRAWVCWLALTTTTVDGANQPVTMKISPAVSFAPANLIIRTRLEPHVNNRAMEVIAESADFYRSSAMELAGDRAPRTLTFEFRGLPPGEYEVTAAVIGTDD